MNRRAILRAIVATMAGRFAGAAPSVGERLATAARAQVGITTSYDPTWTSIRYPEGDVPRSTGVCADVIIRAARDALGLDLQKLVHEDMIKHFDAYPARRTWGQLQPDANIDHRRVLNLEAYFRRCGACLWHANGSVPGDEFPKVIETGDILTWLLDARLPHIGIVFTVSGRDHCMMIHNVGRGAEETQLSGFHSDLAAGHYRWPVRS